MTYTYKVQSILQLFNHLDEEPDSFQVSEEDNIYYIGGWDELKDEKEQYELKPGTWLLFDYYDHLWFHFMIHQDHINSPNTLKLDRTTPSAAHYGHVLASWMQDAKKETIDNQELLEEWDLSSNHEFDRQYGYVTFGRGEVEVELRMLRNKKGQVLAVLYGTKDFLKDANTYLYS